MMSFNLSEFVITFGKDLLEIFLDFCLFIFLRRPLDMDLDPIGAWLKPGSRSALLWLRIRNAHWLKGLLCVKKSIEWSAGLWSMFLGAGSAAVVPVPVPTEQPRGCLPARPLPPSVLRSHPPWHKHFLGANARPSDARWKRGRRGRQSRVHWPPAGRHGLQS